MIKNKLDFKLINAAIIALIIFLFYMTNGFWLGGLKLLLRIVTPFVLAFALAHALYPLLKMMEHKGISKGLSISFIAICLFGSFILIIWLVVPLSLEQISGLYSGISKFIYDMSFRFEINLRFLEQSLADIFNPLLKNVGYYISNGTWAFLNTSITAMVMMVAIMFVAIYFLIDMDVLRKKAKMHFTLSNKKTYHYLKLIDYEMNQYFLGLGKVLLWQLLEYTVVFFFIGHPNYLLIGVLASITTVIPYLGAWLTNILALITAFVISGDLFLLTGLAIIILSLIDGYIVTPKIFDNTNQISPLVSILTVFAGGVIYGVLGVIVSLPVAIILIKTFKYYRQDIFKKVKK